MHPTPFRALSVALAAICLSACTSPDPVEKPPSQPDGWQEDIRLPEAVDTNPDPHIFETTLTAQLVDLEILPGTTTPVWTYNGTLPGPLIRVQQGDRLIVHFENQLSEPTTVHWHGIRLPNAMDGVPSEEQPAIEPGGAFDYEFDLPDAGLYWYHPHANSAAQVGFGLYGALQVDDPTEPAGIGEDLTLVVSDMALYRDGSPQPADSAGALGDLFGREGDTLLVNGKLNPVLRPRSGLRQRWRVVNTSKSRYFQIGVEGHSFTRIGGDAGLTEGPEELPMLIVPTAERADALLTLQSPPGSELAVRWIPYDRGYGTAFNREEALMFTMEVAKDPAVRAPNLPQLTRTIEPIDVSFAKETELALTQNDKDGKFALGINGVPSWDAEPLMAKIGETHVWRVRNTLPFAHPFHLHGFFFQVLDVNGVPPNVREWDDTASVPVDATLSLAVKFDERPGMWMFHCHILDHADTGMMGMVHLHE